MVEAILPGTYISVRDEGLISAGSVSTGNIGIVGTAAKGAIDTIQLIGSFSEAKEIFGDSDPLSQDNKSPLTLIRALELLYNNGGKTVYAVRTASKNRAKASYLLKDGTTTVLKLEAKGSPGSWGNGIGIKITDIPPIDDKDKTTSKKIELIYGAVQETYFFTPGAKTVADLQKTLNERSVLVTAPELASTSANKSPDNTDNKVENFSGGNDGTDAGKEEYQSSLALLENDIINIVLLAGQDNSPWAGEVLEGHLKYTAGIKRERIGLIGSGLSDDDQKEDIDAIANHSLENDRLIFVAPGIRVTNRVNRKQQDKLSGGYTAAAIAGLLSSLPVQTSPTNKTLSLSGLSTEFNASQLEKLVSHQVLVVGKQEGYRVIKGITTHRGAWQQITTRRIVDYAIYGVRSGCNPYIGKLNNERVRGAMKATLDAFLTRMVNDEALVGYSIEVSATRAQEVAGVAMVTMTLQPTFSIDFIKVTMYLG
jgi:Phage tail sheath C-terminal domain